MSINSEEGKGTLADRGNIMEKLCNGITTVVGLLGADNITRTMEELYAKAKKLKMQGMTAISTAAATADTLQQ